MTRATRTDRLITFVREPAQWVSVVVQVSNAAIILPSESSSGTYQRLGEIEPWPGGTWTFVGETAPWPIHPEYALDRAVISGIGPEQYSGPDRAPYRCDGLRVCAG